MTTGRSRLTRVGALLRLVLLAGGVAAAFAVAVNLAPASADDLRDSASGSGPSAAVAFVAAGAVLTVALFPFPVLAIAAGLVFGTVLGTVVSVAAETAGAAAAFLIARRWGAESAGVLIPGRLTRLLEGVRRRAFVTVLYARIVPGVPRGAANYAFGLSAVPLAPFTAATALGTAPRAFAYAALGSALSLTQLDSPQQIAAVVALGAMALLGAAVLVLERRRARC